MDGKTFDRVRDRYLNRHPPDQLHFTGDPGTDVGLWDIQWGVFSKMMSIDKDQLEAGQVEGSAD